MAPELHLDPQLVRVAQVILHREQSHDPVARTILLAYNEAGELAGHGR